MVTFSSFGELAARYFLADVLVPRDEAPLAGFERALVRTDMPDAKKERIGNILQSHRYVRGGIATFGENIAIEGATWSGGLREILNCTPDPILLLYSSYKMKQNLKLYVPKVNFSNDLSQAYFCDETGFCLDAESSIQSLQDKICR